MTFKTCPSCRKVYWEGSHADEMQLWIREVMGDEIVMGKMGDRRWENVTTSHAIRIYYLRFTFYVLRFTT